MPLKYEKISPVKYKINAPTEKLVIFTENYNKNWQLGKQKPAENREVNVYEYKGENLVVYKRFYIYLLSYAVSLIALVIFLVRMR